MDNEDFFVLGMALVATAILAITPAGTARAADPRDDHALVLEHGPPAGLIRTVCHLLRTYSGSGKTFYIGHWEGDGWLRGSVAPADDARADEVACQGMAD